MSEKNLKMAITLLSEVMANSADVCNRLSELMDKMGDDQPELKHGILGDLLRTFHRALMEASGCRATVNLVLRKGKQTHWPDLDSDRN